MLALKADLAYLKTKVDNVNVDKLKTVPADISKLMQQTVLPKRLCDRKVAKVNFY